MAQEIFDVKLYELDEKIKNIHNTIRSSQSDSHNRLKEKIKALEEELDQIKFSLEMRLKFSKAPSVASLSKTYEQIEKEIKNATTAIENSIFTETNLRQNQISVNISETQILLAEYSLDFALLAVNHALLSCLKAMETQRIQEMQTERSTL